MGRAEGTGARSFARLLTHLHIVEFIFIAEIAAIHSRPVIYSGERSSAPRPARTRSEKGSRGAEIESPSTSKTNIISHEAWLPAKLITSCLFDVSRVASFDRLLFLALSLSLSLTLFLHVSLKHAFPIDRFGKVYWIVLRMGNDSTVNSLEIRVSNSFVFTFRDITFLNLVFCFY